MKVNDRQTEECPTNGRALGNTRLTKLNSSVHTRLAQTLTDAVVDAPGAVGISTSTPSHQHLRCTPPQKDESDQFTSSRDRQRASLLTAGFLQNSNSF